MGSSYNKNITQWSKGEYTLANNNQDDIAIIGTDLGFRPDDAGATLATTAPFATSGLLNNTTDTDVYAITLGAGTVNVSATGYRAGSGTHGGNTDLKLELLDGTGAALANALPTTSTKASLTFTIATASTYYLRLTPDDTRDTQPAAIGYTTYGSIGQYTLAVSGSASHASTVITTQAGKLGTSGSLDASGTAATFSSPTDVTASPSGLLFVVDSNNHTIRQIAANGTVSTLAGQVGVSGSLDGNGLNARFRTPKGLAADSSGNLYLADTGNHTIRKIAADGAVTTLAGLAETAGSANGTANVARFNAPSALALDGNGTLYVADTNNHLIRKITLTTNPIIVSTLSGLAGTAGSTNGTADLARFNTPSDLTLDGSGNLYIADTGNHTLRKIALTPSPATVSTLAGQSGTIGKLDGLGTAATLNRPAGLALGTDGNLYVADTSNHIIRRVTPDGLVVTLAGLANNPGGLDGADSNARFNTPRGMTVDANGYLYIADQNNHAIRVASSAPFIIKQPQSQTVAEGATANFTVNASGQPTPTYQWNKDGTAIGGATSATLTLANAGTANAGSYTVTLSNSLGTTTSDAATLTLTKTSSSSTSSSSSGSSSSGGGGAPGLGYLAALSAAALGRFAAAAARRKRIESNTTA